MWYELTHTMSLLNNTDRVRDISYVVANVLFYNGGGMTFQQYGTEACFFKKKQLVTLASYVVNVTFITLPVCVWLYIPMSAD